MCFVNEVCWDNRACMGTWNLSSSMTALHHLPSSWPPSCHPLTSQAPSGLSFPASAQERQLLPFLLGVNEVTSPGWAIRENQCSSIPLCLQWGIQEWAPGGWESQSRARQWPIVFPSDLRDSEQVSLSFTLNPATECDSVWRLPCLGDCCQQWVRPAGWWEWGAEFMEWMTPQLVGCAHKWTS